MSEGTAEELPPVVAALQGDDESFLAMLERDIAALEKFREDVAAAMSGAGGGGDGIAAGIVEGADAGAAQLVTRLEEAGAEGSDAAATEIVETLTAAGDEGGTGLAEGVTEGAMRASAALEEIAEAQAEMWSSLGALTRQEFSEAAAQAEQARQEYQDLQWSIEQHADSVGLPVHRDDAAVFEAVATGALTYQEALAQLRVTEVAERSAAAAAVEQLQEASSAAEAAAPPVERLRAAIEALAEAEAAAAEPAVQETASTRDLVAANADLSLGMFAAAEAQAAARVSTESLIAAQAQLGVEMLASAEADVVAAAEFAASMQLRNTALTTAMLAGNGASEVIKTFGSSEAQAAVASATLGAALEQLAAETDMLLISYIDLQNGGTADLTWLQHGLSDLAAAQQTVAASAAAMVAGQNEVNLAVVRNQTAFLDEATALRSLQTAAEVAGVEVDVLARDLEEGAYAALDKAAADAKAGLEAEALAAAQQRLAAANLTLVDTYARLSAAEEVSAEEQAAVLASARAAASEVAALDTSAAAAGHSMARFGGGMGIAQMAAFSLLSYIPQLIGGLEQLGGVGDHTAIGVGNMEASLVGLNSTIPPVGDNLAALGFGLSALSNIRGGGAGVQGIQDLDNALAQLYQTDPQLASEDVATLTKSMEASGTSQSQIAQYLTAYNAAVQQTSISLAAQQHAIEDTVPGTQAYGIAVEQNTIKLQQNVLSTEESNDALASYGEKLLAAQSAQDYVNSAVAAAGVTMRLQAQATDVTNQATVDYTMDVVGARAQVEAMNNALQASYMSMVSQAQSSAQASAGLLQLGTAQQTANYALVDAEQGYTQASNGATAYGTALTALSGTENSLLGTEAAFTTSLGNLTTAVKTNGDSLDVNTTKGAANITAITGIANAADKAASAVYQNEVNTDGASKAYDDATKKLLAEKDAFEQAAEKAGFNKTQVEQLADELFKLPPTLTIGANTSYAIKQVDGLVEYIDQQTGTVNVVMNSSGSVLTPGGSRNQAHAAGGLARAGELALFGEEGPELGVPTQDMNIIPAGQTAQILGGGVGSSLSLSSGVGGGGDTYIFNFYPGVMLGDEYAFTDAIQQAMGRLGLRVPNQYASVATTRGR